ncbi:unnamed protein product [Mytilus coruscus]|uniref:Uncharacterized protein n=1 Tax=Mytilus coruscus TaxID=42192 RepID=A0A6J8CVR1_MYTCO|nr:unnamed protein product [Mytilus coruscus]
MGRKNRKRYKDPILSEIEERERIKQCVLQVFRARYSVPGESGAIVVGKDQPSYINLTKSNTVHEGTGESSSNMTESESSTSSDKKTHKKRRRRKRQKPQRKGKKVETTDRHDVTKHLKIANDVSHTLRPIIDASKVSSICQNRLTRKMGLFNAGKKSSTISREIYIPDAVKKKTQEDLKKILNQSVKEDDNQSLDDRLNISHSPLILPKPSYRASSTANSSKKSDLGYRSAGSNSITHLHLQSSASCLSAASSEDLREILPEEPPMEAISELLIKNLNLKQFFPGRNLFEETVEELRKIMKQNSFSSTPVSKKLHAKQVDSVKRSLLDIYSPAKPQGNVKVPSRPSSVKTTSSTNMSQSPQMSKIQPCITMHNHKSTKSSMNCDKYLFPKTTDVTYESSSSQVKEYLDEKSLINRCNNSPIYSMASISYKHSSTVTQSPRKYLRKDSVDAKTLLKCNDKMIAEACHQMEQLASKPQPMETDDSNASDSNALNLLKQDEAKKMKRHMSYHGDTLREIQRDILSLLPDDIAQNSSQSSGYHGSQNSRYGHEEQTSRLTDQVCIDRMDNYSVFFMLPL